MTQENDIEVIAEESLEQDAAPRSGAKPGLLSRVTIGQRISAMAAMLLILTLGTGAFSAIKINAIGVEITGLAERDMPLLEVIAEIESKQLEQSIEFERAVRFGELMVSSLHAEELFFENRDAFDRLSAEVTELLHQGEEIGREAIETATSEAERQEFQSILTQLEGIEVAHTSFETHSHEVFGLLEEGHSANVEEAIELVEAEETALNHEITQMRHQISEFSRKTLHQVEVDEKLTLKATIMLSIVSVIIGIGAAVFIIRGIVGPIGKLTHAMDRLAAGDLTVDVHGSERGDELGAMSTAVQVFKDNAVAAKQLEAEQETERAAKEARVKRVDQLARDFESAAATVLGDVTSAADQVKSSATSMSATADQTNEQCTAVSAASEEASSNVETVAAASEELASSITEISRQVQQSTKMSTKAVSEAEAANMTVQGLADAARGIGDVVDLINNIASQTNLLALNATIEAARAGEAGKGFAVVASEVKSLASQTAKATEEISSQITSIQAESTSAVEAIDGIRQVISEVDEIAGAIAAAVEEQGAATQEIARNVQQAAAGTQEVSANIAGVTQAANETGQAATTVMEISDTLNTQADLLRRDVEQFLADIKSA